MAWLFFNQDLKFSSSGAKVIENKRGTVEVNTIVLDMKIAHVPVVEKIKGPKCCHADEPDW